MSVAAYGADGFNRPPATYSPENRRGRLNAEKYDGLVWRMRVDGSVVWEFSARTEGARRTMPLPNVPNTRAGERQAIAEWKILSGESTKGKPVIPSGKVTTRDVWLAYEARMVERGKARSTRTSAEINYRLHLGPVLGTRPFAKITADDWADFFRRMKAKGLSDNAQLTIKSLVNGLYKLAIRKGWVMVGGNTYALLEQDERPQKRNKPGYKPKLVRVEGTLAMIEKVNPLYRNMLVVLACTGLRISELCGLTWADIAIEDGKLYVVQQLQRDDDGKIIRDGLKTRQHRQNNAERTVVIVPLAAEALRAQQRNERLRGYGQEDDFVFTTSANSGLPITQDNFRNRGVKKAAADAGLGHVRPHDLRHTTASIFAEAEISIPAAAKMMGHSVKTYQAIYAHAFEDEQEFEAIRGKLAKVGFGALALVPVAA